MRASRQIALFAGIVLVVVGVIIGGRYLIENRAKPRDAVVIPELSSEAKTGEIAFTTYCVSCHGKNAAGTDKGPPLVNQIYRPLHHSDFSFVRAVTLGVPQHHWLFGAMPPQPQVERKRIDQIVIYIRELQKANGIK
jgi:mono/diheme cytochrome c family protein